jgi:hypothetical protein
MSEPFIFATTLSINEGQLESLKELSKRFTEVAEESDTVIAYHFHVSEDESEISNVQVHTDAASMDAYLPLVGEKIGQALELSKTISIDVYGKPGPALQDALRHNAEQGARVRVKPTHIGGFTRSAAA